MIVDLDGTLIEAAEARVSPFDAAYMYGDGLFDTVRAYRGFLFRFEDHLERLEREAELLRLAFDPNPVHWRARIESLLGANDLLDTDARVRLQVSRGGDHTTDHTRTVPAATACVELVTARAVSDDVERQQEDGVRVMTLQSAFARGNFPQVKSLNYLPSIMALRFAREEGFDEALLLNAQKRVLEGATSNVFAVRDGVLRTPSARLGLLPGITRQVVMDLARSMDLRVEEVMGELKDVLLADEVFLTGSIKEIVPVTHIDESIVGDGMVGVWTRRLQEAYRDAVESVREDAHAEGTGEA